MNLSRIVIGAMRFPNRQAAVETIHAAIDAGFNYIDTSPCYCRKDEQENSEAWVGAALNQADYRERVMVSTKCTPGNGGLGLGDFMPEGGFGVRSAAQLEQVFAQSLGRMNLPSVDYYHLWTTHTREQFAEAMKPGGWYEGVKGLKGKWQHLGVTTHADTQTIVEFLESGLFETVTIPLNIVNTTRLGVVDYCVENGIRVIAMNPLAGGFLAKNEELKELALRYLLSLPNVHVLIGFSSAEEVAYAKWVLDTLPDWKLTADQMLARVNEMLDADQPRCTACGYCQPCPHFINVGACLSYYNLYKYMGMEEAKAEFNAKQWEDGLRLDKCTGCGLCSSRCPNQLPLGEIIRAAQVLLYDSKS